MLIVRSLIAISISAIPPLVATFNEEIFFPIPPNRECIESVDMVLHIPVAVDYFYDYLVSRQNSEAIHCFALYIDLRMYDKACADEVNDDEKLEYARSI